MNKYIAAIIRFDHKKGVQFMEILKRTAYTEIKREPSHKTINYLKRNQYSMTPSCQEHVNTIT